MSDTITYEQVAFMQSLTDIKTNKKYFMLGKVTNENMPPNTFAVTPQDGNGETLFYCLKHETAYGLQEACLDCRLQPREEPQG